MNEALIFDAVRTPRGKGKRSGSLNEVTPVQLASKVLKSIESRNNLDTADVDDVVLGCVHPIGEQGADIARTAVLAKMGSNCKWSSRMFLCIRFRSKILLLLS